MRKKLRSLTLLALFAGLTTSLSAQEFTRKEARSALFASVGANHATIMNVENRSEVEPLWGLNAGIGFVGVLNKRGTTMISIEALFSMQGTKLTGAVNSTDPEQMKLNYFNFPVMVRHHPFKNFRSFYITAGPQISLHAGGHVLTEDGSKMEFKEGFVTKTLFDGVAGAGVLFGRTLNGGLQFNYQHGFTNILQNAEFKNSVYQVKLIFPFDFLQFLAM